MQWSSERLRRANMARPLYRSSAVLLGIALLVCCCCLHHAEALPKKGVAAGLLRPGSANQLVRPSARYCPYCDSSVYGYCSDKLLHDACCCLDPYDLPLPRECRYADCSFLHANTCEEHSLITACCCTNLLK